MKQKRRKFIISLSSFLLSIGAVGVSYALYEIHDEAEFIQIKTTTDNDVEYSINLNKETGVLSPITQVNNAFTVGGTKIVLPKADPGDPDKYNYTQNVIVGDLEVEIILPNSYYAKALVDGKSHIYLDINAGSGQSHFAEHAYFIIDGNDNTKIRANFSAIPVYLAGTPGILTREIVVGESTDPQITPITLEEYAQYIAGLPATSITMTWKHPAVYEYAYIVGSMDDSRWISPIDKYLMVPNPKGPNYEWMYEGTFAVGDEIKGKLGNNFSGGDNKVFAEDDTLTGAVYWSGSKDDEISWVAQL